MDPPPDLPTLEHSAPKRRTGNCILTFLKAVFHIFFWSFAGIILFVGCPRMWEEMEMEDGVNCSIQRNMVSEAIQDYAERHEHRLPGEISQFPSASCPRGGGPYRYKVLGETFELTCPDSDHMKY